MAERDAFNRLVTGVDYPMFVVTAGGGKEVSGCLVGFATQASIDPPRLVVMISKANHTFGVAARSPRLVVHFLHEANGDLAELFGGQTGDEVDKFGRCDWSPLPPDGPPVLAGTQGWVSGRVVERLDAGDHVAHLLTVERACVEGPARRQLSFQATRGLVPGHPA